MRKAYYSVLATLLLAATSMADTNKGSEFKDLWDKMLSYVQGLPGIMAALAILVVSLYMAFFGGKGPLVFFGGIITAAAIFIIPNIVQGMGGSLF